MDTKKSKHVSGTPAASAGPPTGANALGVHGCGIPKDERSSTNSSTADSANSNAGSEDGGGGPLTNDGRRRSPYSSDSSDFDVLLPPPGAAIEPKRRNTGHIRKASAPQPRSSSATLMASTPSAANVSSRSKTTNFKTRSGESQKEDLDACARLATASPCVDCRSSQHHQPQKRMCSFYSEPVAWRQDSSSRRASEEPRSPGITATDVVNLLAAPSRRKETSIAVQGNSGGAGGGGRAANDERPPHGSRVTRAPGAHLRRSHGQTRGASTDRLPLHRIMNDPRVYYVLVFAGLAALMVISATGLALAARRRRRKRRHNVFGNGLSAVRNVTAATLYACATYFRWLKRLVS